MTHTCRACTATWSQPISDQCWFEAANQRSVLVWGSQSVISAGLRQPISNKCWFEAANQQSVLVWGSQSAISAGLRQPISDQCWFEAANQWSVLVWGSQSAISAGLLVNKIVWPVVLTDILVINLIWSKYFLTFFVGLIMKSLYDLRPKTYSNRLSHERQWKCLSLTG